MATHFLMLIMAFGLARTSLGHGRVEPLPKDPSWCVNGKILEIGECLCNREQEDSCVGSRCFRQMGLSWYKPSCKDCKCKPESAKPTAPARESPSTATGGGQCGGPPSAASGCSGGGDAEKGMPDWFGKDEEKPPSRSEKGSGNIPQKKQNQKKRQAPPKQQHNQDRTHHQKQPNRADINYYQMLQQQGSPLEAERNRRHKIVGIASFGFAAFFAFLFWSARARRTSADTQAKAKDNKESEKDSDKTTKTTVKEKKESDKETEQSTKDEGKDKDGGDDTEKEGESKEKQPTSTDEETKKSKEDKADSKKND